MLFRSNPGRFIHTGSQGPYRPGRPPFQGRCRPPSSTRPNRARPRSRSFPGENNRSDSVRPSIVVANRFRYFCYRIGNDSVQPPPIASNRSPRNTTCEIFLLRNDIAFERTSTNFYTYQTLAFRVVLLNRRHPQISDSPIDRTHYKVICFITYEHRPTIP